MNTERLQTLSAVCAAAGVMLMSSSALAAGFANTAQSATSTAMSGVATANPNEPNASFYNPAGMAFQEGFGIYAGPTMILPSIEYTSPDGDITEETEFSTFFPPNFHASYEIGAGLAAGVGVTFPWGLGVAWPDDWHGRETFRSQSLETLNVNPNVAYRVPGIDLGVSAGVQVLRSSLRQRRAAVVRPDNEVDVALGGVGHGIGFTAASQYRPTDEITVGVNYRSGATMEYEGDARFSDDVEGTPFERRMIDQEISTQLNIPHTISAGIGWQATEPLWVGFDVNYMTWSDYDRVEVQYSEQSPEGEPGETEPPTVVEGNWNDAVALRLGAEYEIVERLAARTGFAVDMTPVPDETVAPSLPDNHRLNFSAGLGANHAGFLVDLAYQYVFLPARVIDNGNVDGTYRMGSHVVGLNVGYRQ